MLDAFIIEEIKRRERGRSLDDRPVIELPIPQPPSPAHHDDDWPANDRPGSVVIIDYAG
ncbi:MAG TPA: hypothetical protein VMK12_14315 [Anaeromyxobacteraceae bacterium]|nr:hypothetical protein [Anaeromyxobacteraceae bacterium]